VNLDPNAMLGLFELPPDGKIWEWAEECIIIPARTPTNFPGAYRSELAIYTRDILDLIQDPAVNTIIFEKGAQVGATLLAIIALAYWCDVDPGPAMIVYPTEDIARSVSETRVMPVFEESPRLAALIPSDRKQNWTKLQYRLKKNVVNYVGSNSPANLASRAVRYLITDEEDKYPARSKEEADPVSLASQRLKTFGGRRKHLRMSTPTTSTGHIHRAYLSGDRRRLYLPCPHCGLMQFLQWAQIKFDAKKPIDQAAMSSVYECAGCKRPIMDGHKPDMLKKREWKSSAVSDDPATVSLHLSSLYAPWVTWSQLVRKFLQTRNNPEQLQDFINSELGEPFDPIDTRIYDETIADREGDYPDGKDWADCKTYADRFKGLVRNEDYATFIGCDVQKGYIRMVARTFLRSGDSAQVYRAELSGFDALLKLADSLQAEYIGIDTLYRREEVQEFCYEAGAGFYPIHGVSTRAAPLIRLEAGFDIDEGKRRVNPQARTLDRFAIHSDQALSLLADCIQQTRDKAGNPTTPQWFVGKGVGGDKAYCRELTARVCQGGKWVNPQQRADHYSDCEKITIALAVHFGFWKWVDVDADKEGAKDE
jgi:hypothetical protein